VDEVVLMALKDPAPAKCAAAALVVGRYGTPEQRQAVRRLLDDDNPVVRLRAAQGLACARDPSALPALIGLLGKTPLPLARQAEDMLTRAAGASAPKVHLTDDPKSREPCQRAWEEWWGAHKGKLDLVRADLGSPFGGQIPRARAITREFLETMTRGDIRKALALTDVPFAIDGFMVLRTRAELDALFAQAKVTEQDKMEFTIKAVVPLEDYLRRTTRPPMEDFLKVIPKAGVRAVYVEGQQKQGRRETVALFVRFQGGQARIIGLGIVDTPEMPAKK
jgi:HEAT repeat protein